MASGKHNYYTNPAFCQQSEFYNAQQRCTSPRERALQSPERRQPPVGAHKPTSHEAYHTAPRVTEVLPKVGPKPKPVQRRNSIQVKSYNDNEPNYEEMLVDDSYPPLSTTRKTQDHDNQKYLDASNGNVKQTKYNYGNGNEQDSEEYLQERRMMRNKGRYEVIPGDDDEPEDSRTTKHRYEYIPMQEHANGYPSSPRKQLQQPTVHCEDLEVVRGRVHRYSVIPAEEVVDLDKPSTKGRYALVPVSEIKPNSRYAVIPAEEIGRNVGRYDYIPQPQPSDNRHYHETNQNVPRRNVQQDYYVTSTPIKAVTSPQTPRKGNPIATQKLHELLTTPRKVQRSQSMMQYTPKKVLSPQAQWRPLSPQPVDPFCTPNKTPPKVIRHQQMPRAQQKLNYTLSTRQENATVENKRHTAVIAPICSSPVQSVYSETTFSNKTESWMNLSMKRPAQGTLAVAAVMMILCGGLTSALCFYMISVVGRMYYLDFGIVSGFACLLLGLLAFRARNCHLLPNRNYISGYIVLSAFSLLTCAGLLVLLFLQPKPGSPLADVTSGAVCGISGLSLLLASAGVIASYCCKYPPPDNRVQHCAPGFTV